MGALIKLVFAFLFIAMFLAVFFFFISNLIGGIAFNPASRAWAEMLRRLREQLARVRAGSPVSLDGNNLAELALQPKILKKSGWRDHSFEGFFHTIYQETVMVFVGQKIGKTAVWLCRTADREYILRKKEKETEIWCDGKPWAVWINNQLLDAGRQSRLLANVQSDPELRQWPVLIGTGEAATLTNPEKSVSPIPRALTLLRPLQPEEEQVLLLLSVIKGL